MSQDKPNILLVTTDQQRFDTAGPLAPPWMRTPHFDHLCREGVRFERAYADCPICVPARTSIMTGQTVFRHGMSGNSETSKFFGDEGTLPTVMRGLGYQTAAIGKMHFGPQRRRHGWEEMILPEDYYREMERSGNPQQPMRHGLGQNELYPSMATVPESLTLTSWIAERCVDYIHERRDPSKPFLLWCSFSKPHPPLDPPEPYYSMYRGCDIPSPIRSPWSEQSCPEAFKRFRESWSLDLIPPQVLAEARAAYYGLITQCDYNMGRVFAALQDVGLFQDALILYCSDHGELLGDHKSGSKMFFHEGSSHVPFAIKPPRSWREHGLAPGAATRSLATHADILPTLCRAAGGAPPEECDGQDLLAIARSEIEGRKYLEATCNNGQYFAITDGRWKYIFYPEGGQEQLFDLESDPQEALDLAPSEEHDEQKRALQGEMVARHQSRSSQAVENGKLLETPLRHESEAERRARAWPGYHTERHPVDVRH